MRLSLVWLLVTTILDLHRSIHLENMMTRPKTMSHGYSQVVQQMNQLSRTFNVHVFEGFSGQPCSRELVSS